MIPITTLLQVALLAAPFVAYGYATVKTRAEERGICKIQIVSEVKKVADKLNEVADAKVAEAIHAAETVAPTPKSKPELVALCNKSASCRERAKK